MNILEKFNVLDTQERIRSDFAKGFDTRVEQVDQTYEIDDPWSQVYEYRTLLKVRFTANSADYDRALDNAKMQTQSYIYNDVLVALCKIQTCVYNGDARSTLEEINKIRTLIMEID